MIFSKSLVLCASILVVSCKADTAVQSAYGRCGGIGYTGATACVAGYECQFYNDYYSQCVPYTKTASDGLLAVQTIPAWGQCGGLSYTGATVCGTAAGYACRTLNSWYAQCQPYSSTSFAAAAQTPKTSPITTSKAFTTSTLKTVAPTTLATSTKKSATFAVTTSTKKSAAPIVTTSTVKHVGTSTFATSTKKSTTSTIIASSSRAPATTSTAVVANTGSSGLKFGGVNIAGFDFGMNTDGSSAGAAYPPVGAGNPDGAGQMSHFFSEGLNIFRLPVSWQYLTNSVIGTLNAANLATYDGLVQSCLSLGAHCIIDIHNYARWNGAIIGQDSGAPTNAEFASLWSQLATKYASQSNVIFGIMNEPHDLDMTIWAVTVQAAVSAIRSAGATTQLVLLPGTDYTSATEFISQSLTALSTVKDSDGTTSKLIYDIHQYLDADSSGTNAECVRNNIDAAFYPLATALRSAGRQALLSETGGSSAQSCVTYLGQQLAFVKENADVYLGFTAWAAGSFDTSYTLGLTPNSDGTDQLLVTDVLLVNF